MVVGLRRRSQIAQLSVFPADLSPWARLAKLNVVTVTTSFVSSLLLHFFFPVVLLIPPPTDKASALYPLRPR